MATIAELEKRMAAGETYLDNHPTDAKARDLYRRYEAEYVTLKEAEEREQDIKAVWLDLPEGTRWQRQGYDTTHSRVRVLFGGQPAAGDELTRAELAVLLADRREALEMARVLP